MSMSNATCKGLRNLVTECTKNEKINGQSFDKEHVTWSIYAPRCEKTGLRGFRPGPTQTRLYNHTIWLEA